MNKINRANKKINSFIKNRMKRSFILLSLIAFLMQCATFQLMGQDSGQITATWVASELNLANNTSVTDPFVIDNHVRCQFAKGEGSSVPTFFTSYGNHVRLYAKNKMTITPLNGASISRIEFTFMKSNKTYLQVASVSPEGGTWTDPTPTSNYTTAVATWQGQEQDPLKTDLVFTFAGSGQRYLIQMVVTYSAPGNTFYHVTYKPNGGVGEDIVVTEVYNTTITVMENPFDRDEFDFASWNTQANGQGVEYIPGTTFSLENDIVLYAKWTTSPNLFVDVLTPTNVNAAIGNLTGYNAWTLNLPDSQNRRITYQGKSLKSANSIQMNSSISGTSAYSGIATTFTHNLKAKKVKVTWSGASSDGCTLLVYGKDTPYSGPSDLYGDTQGTLLGSIVKGTSAEFALTGIYPYIGLRSSSGVIYLDEIRIIWEPLNTTAPVVRIEPTTVNLGNVAINNPLSVDFTVSQANLTEVITLQLDSDMGAFSIGSETVTTIPTNANPTVVTWNYTPTTTGVFNVHVTATSSGSSSHLTISGTVLDATAQSLHGSKAAFVNNSSQNSACINLDGVEVIAQSGNYLYLQDAEAGLLVYGAGAPTFQTTPCKFTRGYLQGTFVNYHGIIELQNFQFVDPETTQNMVLTATTATVDDILDSPSDYDSRYVQLNDVNIDGWTLSGNNGTLAFHDRFQTGYASKTAPETNDPFTVKGLVNGYYSSGATNYQIDPIFLADIHTIVRAPQPSVSPEGGTASNPLQTTTVRVGPPSNVQGYAVYYYKINEGESIPFTTWTYINLYERTTLTAYGTRDFYENSEVKTSYYELPQNVHAVRFSINGVVNPGNNALVDVNSRLEENQTPNVTCLGDFGFAGWSLSEDSTETITFPYTVDEDITLYAVYAKGSNFVYKKVTNVSEIVDGEYAIICEVDSRYILKNESSNHSPTAYSIASLNISINSNGELVGDDLSMVTWNFTGTSSNLQITSTANTTNHLYIIGNSSTGVRVGQTSGNTSWSISEDQSVVEQFNMMSNGRYLVVYNSQDWRSYLNMADGAARMLLFRKQAVIDGSAPRYTRVFWNETATGNINLVGPSIIPSGYYLNMNVDYTMTNDVSANFLIEDGASFKLANGNTGIKATVKKDIVGYVYDTARIGWHLLSSPIGAFLSTDDRVPAGLLYRNFDLYGFDQAQSEEWQNHEDPEVQAVAFGAQGGVLYANKDNTTIVFDGELTATVQPEPLAYTPNVRMSGWNLIGNPYTCDSYLNIEPVGEGEGQTISDYYYLKDVSENGKKFSKLIATSLDTPVHSMEGVFVQAPSAGYRYWFVNSNRGQNVAQSEYVNIKLSGDGDEVVDVARVRFNEGCLMGKFDFGEGGSQLYIPQGGKKYAVVPTQCQGELPLSFKAAQNGTFTLEFDLNEAEIGYLHLIDNKTGAEVDLMEMPTYTFDATTDDYAARFRLLFEANGAMGNDNFAYYDGSTWVVTGCHDNATLQVVDVMGRVLSSQTVNGSAELNINQAQGVYVLRLINGNEIKSQKIVVR